MMIQYHMFDRRKLYCIIPNWHDTGVVYLKPCKNISSHIRYWGIQDDD